MRPLGAAFGRAGSSWLAVILGLSLALWSALPPVLAGNATRLAAAWVRPPAACTEYLRPARIVTIRFPSRRGQNVLGSPVVAVDPSGDIGWTVQGISPQDKDHELFVYSASTHSYSRLTLQRADGSGSFGLLGISPQWIVFAIARSVTDGSDWRIVAKNRAS